MNILILGGAGFLGNNLVRYCLTKKRHSIVVVDSLEKRLKSSLSSLKPILPKITFIKGDIRDLRLMKRVVKNTDRIFNCAAQTSHPLSLRDPLWDVSINCHGHLTVLEALRMVNKKAVIIYTSSSTVVGESLGKVVDETRAEYPLDIYSANKTVVEKYYRIYNRVYGLKTASIRFANLYGPYGKGHPEFGFVNFFIHRAYHDQEITIFGDGKQHRNIMYVEDAADLLYKAAQTPRLIGNVYFGVHREHYSVLTIAKKIISVFKRGKIKKVPWPDLRARIEIKDVIIAGDKLYKALKWEPRYNLRQGLLKTKRILQKQ